MTAETTLQGITVRLVESDANNVHLLVERDGMAANLGGVTVVNGRIALKGHGLGPEVESLVELIAGRPAYYTQDPSSPI